MNPLIDKLLKGDYSKFFKKFALTFSGTSFAQLIIILSAPLLTRIYSVEDFGLFTYFFSIISVFSVLQSLKFQHSVVAEKDRLKSFYLLFISSAVIIIMTSLIYFIFSLETPLRNILQNYDSLLLLICLSAGLMAFYDLGYNYLAKLGLFRYLITVKITQSFFIIISQILFSFEELSNTAGILKENIIDIPFGANGLIAGYFIGQLLSCTLLFIIIFLTTKKDNKKLKKLNFYKWLNIFSENKKFIFFTMPAELLNTSTYFLIIYFITNDFGIIYAGLFGLAQRIIISPLNLISTSFLDVFKNTATQEIRKYNTMTNSYRMLFKILISISILVFIFILLTKNYYGLLFGPEWSATGNLVLILSPFFCLKFIASPLSYSFILLKRQEIDFMWQSGLFILTILIFSTTFDFEETILLLSITLALYYAFSIILSYRAAK